MNKGTNKCMELAMVSNRYNRSSVGMTCSRIRYLLFGTILLLVFWIPPRPLLAQGDAIVPGTIRTDATFDHIGVRWEVSGDSNLNSSLMLEFRRVGEPEWQPGAPAMRAHPTIRVDGTPLNLNYWGSSALFVEAGQSYELRLTLTDPDGGSTTRTVTATARVPLQPDPAGRQLAVVPGDNSDGTGDGSVESPFRGLQAAADAAQPGDTFTLGSGTYAPFRLLVSGTQERPITFQGDGESVIIDGGNTTAGIITLGEFDRQTGYIILEGLIIQNGAWGIDAQRTHNIAIMGNTVQDVLFGYTNRRENGDEANQTICDNLFAGRSSWPGTGIPYEQGIDLHGTGNTVCYNTVRNFSDCISILGNTGSTYGNDIFGNDVSQCVDDGIEIDYNESNVRVWRNRVFNARMGVSVQPIRGGPAYIFRNELLNIDFEPIKMHNETSGFFIVHNTGVKHGNAYGDGYSMWRNAVLRNNLFLGTRYAFEFGTTADEGFRDLDYNAWGTTRTIDDSGPTSPHFKWNNVRYDRLSELRSLGIEGNGMEAAFEHLTNAALGAGYASSIAPESRDLRLASGAPEIDAGEVLPNFNDAFTINGAPDIGAFELGQPLPFYGPRATNSTPTPTATPTPTSAPTATPVTTPAVSPTDEGSDGPFPGTFPWITGFDMTVPMVGQPKPALNVPFQDDVYGTTIQRISEPIAPSNNWIRHEYSRRPAFNADSTLLLMTGSSGHWNLYRIEDNGSGGEQVLFDHQLPSPMTEPNWHPTNPNRYRYFERNGFGLQIHEYNIETRQSDVIADFNGRLPAEWGTVDYVWTRYEGRPSRDGRIWCLMAEDADFQTVGIFSYDLQADQILGTLAISGDDPDHISTSSNGDYCVPSSTSAMGTRSYTLDFGRYTQLHSNSAHSDVALDADGNDVLVLIDHSSGEDGGWLRMVDMATGRVTRLIYNYRPPQSSAYALHVSGLAVDVPGYVVISTYGASLEHGTIPARYGDMWGHDRLAVVELSENPAVYNVAYIHGENAGYFGEPQATVNRDLTRILFASSWESTEETEVSSYMVSLGMPISTSPNRPNRQNIYFPLSLGRP